MLQLNNFRPDRNHARITGKNNVICVIRHFLAKYFTVVLIHIIFTCFGPEIINLNNYIYYPELLLTNFTAADAQGPDYQNSCKVTMFSILYLELQHESYNLPAML